MITLAIDFTVKEYFLNVHVYDVGLLNFTVRAKVDGGFKPFVKYLTPLASWYNDAVTSQLSRATISIIPRYFSHTVNVHTVSSSQ